LSVPVQLIALKDSSPKWPVMCRVRRETLHTHYPTWCCLLSPNSLSDAHLCCIKCSVIAPLPVTHQSHLNDVVSTFYIFVKIFNNVASVHSFCLKLRSFIQLGQAIAKLRCLALQCHLVSLLPCCCPNHGRDGQSSSWCRLVYLVCICWALLYNLHLLCVDQYAAYTVCPGDLPDSPFA